MAANYTVSKIQEMPRITDQGTVEKFIRVSATTRGGTFFTLDIPASVTRTEDVAKLLDARALQLDTIKGL